MIRSSVNRNSTISAVVLALSLLAACSSADLEDVGVVDSPAKIKGDRADCFPGCSQKDYDALVKDGLAKACKTLKDGWAKKSGSWPGWNDKLPICIGHRKTIEPRTDCNRLVDAPDWTECKNQLMLVCAKEKQPGFGPIRVYPPTKDGFPSPKVPPSITDQELACLDQWKCPNKVIKPASAGVAPRATTSVCLADDDVCSNCDDSWVSYQPAADEPAPVPYETELEATPPLPE